MAEETGGKAVATCTPAEVVQALKDTGGVLKNVAKAVGCSRTLVAEIVRTSPEAAAALQEERDKVDDTFEERLIEQIKQGNVSAMQLFAKLRRERSYREDVVKALVRRLFLAVADEIDDEEAIEAIQDRWEEELAQLEPSRP